MRKEFNLDRRKTFVGNFFVKNVPSYFNLPNLGRVWIKVFQNHGVDLKYTLRNKNGDCEEQTPE